MHNLEFKYIAAQNFMPFGPEGIEVDLTKLGKIVLIKGENHDRKADDSCDITRSKNGTGKSSLATIITYTLYGEVINNKGKVNQDDVIHNKIGKKLRTEVRWGNFRAVRTRKPNSLRLWESADGIWNDTTEISLGGIPATQSLIEDKIGLTFEAFVNTVIFTDNNSSSFLECDTATKRKIVENLLSLGTYREYLEKAKKVRNSHKEKIAAMAKDYERILLELDISVKRIDKIKNQEEEWRLNRKNELSILLNTIKGKETSLKKSDSGAQLLVYNEAQEKIASLNETIPTITSNLDKLKVMSVSVESKQEELRKERNEISARIQGYKLEIQKFRSEIKNERISMEDFDSMKNTICTRCRGVVKEENWQETIVSAKKLIEDREKQIFNLELPISEENGKLQHISTEFENLKNKSSVIDEKFRELNGKITTARTTILSLSKIQRPAAGTDERIIQEQIELLKSQVLSKKQEIDGSGPFVEIIKSAVEEKNIKQTEVLRHKSELKTVEEELPYYDFWVKAFGDSGIRKFVIDGIIPALNARIAHWMQFIIDGKIKLAFDNELNETIETNPSDGDPYVYYAMSGGEKRRLNLAVSQAFAYVMMLNSGKSPSIVFLDEVTTNIDPQGVEGVYNMILELSKTKQVFVTTHDHDLLEILSGCQSISLVRKDGFTRLV